ncbi:MAG: MFS transporter [Streptococcaceae bacterium]|jgi:DHA1 family multidrug resistance protein B-like MFS transporter|nr:MFS transporter [Streptococcaceae bacterium]
MKDFRALAYNLKLRLVIVFLGSFSYGTIYSSMTIYYNQHLGAVVTGALLAVSAVATFFAGLIGGQLSDTRGRKVVMTQGVLLQFVGSLIALFSNLPGHVNAWTTFVGFLLISYGFNYVSTAGASMIIDLSDATNRKTVFGLDYWAQNMAVVIGAGIGAWLFKPAFLALLILLSVEIAVTVVIVVFMMSETLAEKKESADNIWQSYVTVAKDRTYMIFLAANVLSISVIMQWDNFLPVHLADSFQNINFFGIEIYGQRMLTIFLILACLIVVFGMTPANHRTAKWSHQRGFVVGLVFMTLGMVFSFLMTTFWPLIVGCVIYTIGEILYTPNVQTIGANLMDPEKIGAYNGASSIRQPLGSMIAATLVSLSPVIHAWGVSFVLLVTTGISIWLLLRAVERHEKSIESV